MKPNKEHRREILDAIDRGELEIGAAVKALRRTTGKNQHEYAELTGISPRILMQIEQGRGNPTMKSLQKVLAPFGFTLSLRRIAPGENGK